MVRPTLLARRPEVSREALRPDPDQAAAIAHRGSLRIVGGPGTGKTRTLIEHAVGRLEAGHPADRLLLLTYGRDRAADLRDEIAARADIISREPLARTFHSFCFGLLRQHALRTGEPDPVLLSGPEHDSILRDLLRGGLDSGSVAWPDALRLAIPTRGFARELRDLLSRATERGLNPDELELLANRRGRADWAAAAAFYRDYLQVQTLTGRTLVDPSALIVDTLAALDDPDFLAEVRERFPLVLVDDFQESDPSQRALVTMIASEVVLALDPDSAVGRFRGAEPETALESAESLTEAEILLRRDHRSAANLHRAVCAISSGFRRQYSHRERSLVREDSGLIETVRLRSLTAECRYLAQVMRRAHLLDGVPWSHMAVLVRAPGLRVPALQRAFAVEGVPVVVEGSALALADQPAVAPLITIARIAVDASHLTPELIDPLLLSAYGGADPLLLRRLTHEFGVAGDRSLHQALADAILGRDAMADLDSSVVAPVRRIATLVAAARDALRSPGAQAENVLWAIWESALTPAGRPIRDEWQELALAGGAAGVAADADLDAVVALFEIAARFADRRPGSTVRAFFDEIDDQQLPGDTIAARAQQDEVVEIMTVHAARGREWDLVAVCGVQEGEFPNLRMRGSLLGSDFLVAVMRNPDQGEAEIIQGAFPALLDDERRLFHVALSRARTRLLVTAVASEESQPSRFFEELEGLPGVHALDVREAPRSMSMSALIGELRQSDDPDAARVLSHLRSEGVAAADPAHWWGIGELSSTEVIGPRPVSPSAVSTYESCALRWFLQNHGGDREATVAQAVGIAVHTVAEQLIEGACDLAALQDSFERAWADVNVPAGWIGERERQRAWSMILKLERWQRGSDRKAVASEVRVDQEIEGVAVRGTIDRIDQTDSGRYVLVDFKTGASAISKEQAQDDPQLMLYQLAAREGAAAELLGPEPDIAGAELVYVGTTTQTASVRSQPAIDRDAARERLVTIALGMNSASFVATPSNDCRICAVRTSCPAVVAGRAVTT